MAQTSPEAILEASPEQTIADAAASQAAKPRKAGRAFQVQHEGFDGGCQQQLLHLGGVKCRMSAEEIAWHNRRHEPAVPVGPALARRAPKHD